MHVVAAQSVDTGLWRVEKVTAHVTATTDRCCGGARWVAKSLAASEPIRLPACLLIVWHYLLLFIMHVEWGQKLHIYLCVIF